MSQLQLIYNACCEVTELDLSKKTRQREYVYARMVYFHLARHKTNESLSKIGGLVGLNHATVMHGIKKYKDYIKYKDMQVMSKRVSSILPEYLAQDGNMNKEELNMAYLISRNNRLEKQIGLLRKKQGGGYGGFLDEIATLPEGMKQEFEKFKWIPFKKMQESRNHYAFTINQKPIL